ncbi:period circadian protein homolog 1 isoform X1 [Crotalus tigris]|uniref:period circadian protein homolog 1 isoform X1 n=1 Tax=Crotalus tigris TaxID=88082 RepID=UPI00192F1FA1|nr:period circadian protein homolog 1 isoform X1 [Crotalus tigris]XP_039193946.1 period circadian protein homolog 1 isoform X1 [Crotalus tigris]XP_039193947.1 period circadian protein homolog 1 isoform X1 [Crotalus tigris]
MSAGCESSPTSGGGSSSGSSGAPRRTRAPRASDAQGQATDDMDVNSNGSSGNESHGDSHSSSHSSGNGKDSALLETTESNKSSNSQSLSPASSSIAYSLLSASSEQDNPSTSGCSSEQSARVKTQKELMKALKEMKIRLPSEKRSQGKSGTLATLQYALSCVKQVQASQDYYQQWSIDDSQACSLDMSTYTIEELENITSEYTLKNPDTFTVAVSFTTGRILYISDQAAFILRCKKEVFKGAKFAEFLDPQDVSIFYGSTAPYHLPSWSACPSATAMDYTQEKSVFCRISGGHAGAREMRYYPFRLTPYLTKVRDSDSDQGQPCCLLIAERIHSGYEAPRIPPDKRIFTTRHTPSCLFQDVDERAAPLLGYLPQDLVGTPVLFYLHPEDRPLMLAIHKKILQYAGQPFDHSPIRFCARNGEYVTIDTSWSSFVNPWSRKVSFIMGRHKVRTSPVNEDVFSAPKVLKSKALDGEIQELSEQIHRLLLQPVHSSGALGLCSNSASHEQFLSIASSSDSNGFAPEEALALRPMTFQEICKDVHMVKNQGQQVFIESGVKPVPVKPFRPALDPPISHAGQSRQMSREAEKRMVKAATSEDSVRKEPSNYSYQQINCLDVIIRYLESCTIPIRVKRKCGSSSYTASSNSDDDKQKGREQAAVRSKDAPEEKLPASTSQPEREEPGTAAAAAVVGGPLTPLALPSKAESVVSVTSQCSFSSTIVHVGDKKPPESDIVMMEETAPSATPPVPPPGLTPDREQQYRRVGLTKEVLSVHTQKEEQAFLTRFKDLSQLCVFNSPSRPSWQELHRPRAQEERGSRGLRHGPRGPRRGRKSKAKRIRQNKSSDSSSSPQNSAGSPRQMSCPPGAPSWALSGSSPPTLPNMSYPAVMPTYPIPVFSPRPTVPPAAEPSQTPLPALQLPAPLVTPMVALVLPNYVFPQLNSPLPQTYFPGGPLFPFGPPQPGSTLAPRPEAGMQVPSRSSTPHSMSQPERAESPLFESRCSSPLQLNLLQMEELPKPGDRQEASASGPAGPAGTSTDWTGVAGGQGLVNELGPPKETCMVEAHDSSNNDVLSGSSDLLDLLLQEDSRSGTGSAASGSMGSASNGESTSASGTTSSKSSNTSKYFGSIDSSENDLRAKKRSEVEDNEHFIKYVLQDPIWLLMANTDDKVMMSYQLPVRDTETVLREDREKLKQLQKQQPRFTEEQKKELADVHPWIQKGVLPKAINVTACVECESNAASQAAPLYDVEIQDMDLNGMLELMEEGTGPQVPLPSLPLEMAMEEDEAGESRDQPHLVEAEA